MTDSPQLTNAQALEIKVLQLINEAIEYDTPLSEILEVLDKCKVLTKDIIDELEAIEDDGSRAS